MRKDEQNDEILRFVGEFRRETGTLPGELVFNRGLTTITKLDRSGVRLLTLRRHSGAMMEELRSRPASD